MNPLVTLMERYGPMSDALAMDLHQCTHHFSKKKNDHFLRIGQQSSSYFMLSKGILRAYFLNKDKEVNAWFGAENQIFGSILPIYALQPALENIQFLEDAEVYAINVSDMDKLYVKHPELNLIGRKIAEEVCIILEERINSLHIESATTRYHTLIAQHPDLLQRINLGHIASYLGITQETLSRIRK